MGKRTPPGEKPFSPIDSSILHDIQHPDESSPQEEGQETQQGAKVYRIPERKTAPEKLPTPSPAIKVDRHKRVPVTKNEDDDIERLVREMAFELGTPLKLTHLLRATIALLQHSRDELVKQSKKAGASGSFKRPPNNDHARTAVFEHNLAQLVHTALKNTRPFE